MCVMGIKAKHKVFEFLESGLSPGKTAALNMVRRKKFELFQKRGLPRILVQVLYLLADAPKALKQITQVGV
ncbi:MAG: hypothetical protein Q3W91_04915 [Senegalimassilia sp.]|uniref:Uncharacterized protein n=2 Tax=Senegalimassilia anaerobia TaxID=1473216 RepID=A0A369L2C7_9ACTN|nr:hypothetical protein [Senegalimassilia sp.]MDR4054249.1 hypothetical protein [Senegalimassilia sp.]RDB54373.1 hypothetical protein C1880_09190 [Senegalimassilia anaerobia]